MEEFQKDCKVSFDEFKLFYESAEKVTDRRDSANRWNYSICIAIIGAIAAIIAWSISKPSFLIVGVGSVIVLSTMAILYCSLWIGQIRDLKELNNAKFTVINEMARHVSFGDGKNEKLISYQPFKKEWDSLKKAKIAEDIISINIIALKSSNIEYLIPKAFRVLFLLIILVVPFETWYNFDKLNAPQTTTQPSTPSSAQTKP